MDLGTYKFLGGSAAFNVGQADKETLSMLYSGPIQLDEREENNYISFNVYENRTFTRFYVETSTMTLTLEQLSSPTETHPVTVGTYSQSFAKTLSEGMYRVKFKDGSSVN